MINENNLEKLRIYIRYLILRATSQAGSGHPTSSLSATELMTGLFFGNVLRYDIDNPAYPGNDRVIFSKGHASPLFYALWAAAGKLTEDEMLTYRNFNSPLEGHPSVRFPYVEAATGSLGQGLGVGVGMAINDKYLDKLKSRTYVLLGDSEMTEGSQWESAAIAAYYELDNLVGILDVNRLGQRGETMYGHELSVYEQRLRSFGWSTVRIDDGHSLQEITEGYRKAAETEGQPVMLIARTIKGKGVPSVENKDGWHGKALGPEAMQEAKKEWGDALDTTIRGTILKPGKIKSEKPARGNAGAVSFAIGDEAATRDAYGIGLNRIYDKYPEIVALDGEVCNSTRAAAFRDQHPDRYFEMYIAEQNMVSAALGLSRRGKIPFVSTFAAFLTRAFDQIRMNQYSHPNIKFMGSHAGVSIGEDGPSQMGLEDLAMFRTLRNCAVLCPGDAVAMEKLIEEAAAYQGAVYIRCARNKTPVIYGNHEEFPIGGSKTLNSSEKDVLTIVTAGYTLHEVLQAGKAMKKEGIGVRIIDLYSIKPIDRQTLLNAAEATGRILVVEDHYAEGGIGDAVFSSLRGMAFKAEHLAVTRQPKSGDPAQQFAYQQINSASIAEHGRVMVN